MRFGIFAIVGAAALACATTAGAEVAPAPTPDDAGYIPNPDWAMAIRQDELDLYRPIVAHNPGGAIVDCAAKADGHLVDCKTVEVKPTGVHYEDAARLVAMRLCRLKPTLPDGTSVAGKRVRITVIWR